MPAISEDQLVELCALQWKISGLADELKATVDDAMGRITSALVEQVDDPSSTDEEPSSFYRRVLDAAEVA